MTAGWCACVNKIKLLQLYNSKTLRVIEISFQSYKFLIVTLTS